MNQQFADLVEKVITHCVKEKIKEERVYTVNREEFCGIFDNYDRFDSCGIIFEKDQWFAWCTSETARAPINYETAQKIADGFFTSGCELAEEIVVEHVMQ